MPFVKKILHFVVYMHKVFLYSNQLIAASAHVDIVLCKLYLV